MIRKRVLCYGDSNTWGYMPVTGTRYEESVRYPGVMAQSLGDEYRVVEEGLNGRTTVFSDRMEPERCGIEHLLPFLLSHLPLDYLVIMLGTNDTKSHFHVNAREIGYGMEELLIRARHILDTRGFRTKIILVAPVPIYPERDPMFDQESWRKSGELALVFRELAHTYGCLYLDGGSVTRAVGEDGIHLSIQGHRALGEAIAEIIKVHEQCQFTKHMGNPSE
ncbi:SGNH/GDSL hydrolase family protein [Lacrimispora sp. BS-2]|uniref:SGNH/GDSL hydrolase family protein n=1 Tax=Lacrimispora sp. BS-2 TaxID=3151850 RepID=A0AAU7PML7_9FIRM